MKGVKHFGKKEKLSPTDAGPYKILKQIRKVAYALDLPIGLAMIYPVFHMMMLRKFLGDLNSVVPWKYVGIEMSLTYKEVPVNIWTDK